MCGHRIAVTEKLNAEFSGIDKSVLRIAILGYGLRLCIYI
jgi:hypothetical protein